jgi:2-desacetyl-2-hydroxyethyl bacteriochlorophyllide A dehydrogenase
VTSWEGRQVLVTAPNVFELEATGGPEPGDGSALVQMRYVGICGSDLHAVHGRHPFVPLPYHPGHEVVGVVEAVGAGAGVRPGDRVVVEPILACGTCKFCTDGRYNLCTTMTFFGCGAPAGGMADRFVVPADRLHVVPDTLTDLQAVLIEPLSTPVHAVRLAGPDLTGKSVAIIGCGTIGLLTLVAAKRAGAARIAVSDPIEAKRNLALRLGADTAFDPGARHLVDSVRADLGTSADIVFDCVAVQSTIDAAIGMAIKGGTVVVVGVPAAPVTVPLPEIQDLQVRIQGSATYVAEDYEDAIAILAAGLVGPEDIVTAQYPLARVADAFAEAGSGRQIKVVLTPA